MIVMLSFAWINARARGSHVRMIGSTFRDLEDSVTLVPLVFLSNSLCVQIFYVCLSHSQYWKQIRFVLMNLSTCILGFSIEPLNDKALKRVCYRTRCVFNHDCCACQVWRLVSGPKLSFHTAVNLWVCNGYWVHNVVASWFCFKMMMMF